MLCEEIVSASPAPFPPKIAHQKSTHSEGMFIFILIAIQLFGEFLILKKGKKQQAETILPLLHYLLVNDCRFDMSSVNNSDSDSVVDFGSYMILWAANDC